MEDPKVVEIPADSIKDAHSFDKREAVAEIEKANVPLTKEDYERKNDQGSTITLPKEVKK